MNFLKVGSDALVNRVYEAERDLLASVENKWDTTVVSTYTYAHDDLGRRTSVVREGSAFSGGGGLSPSPHHDAWGYNSRSELTDSTRYNNGTPDSPSSPEPPLDRTYGYDPIGNRVSFAAGAADPNDAQPFTYMSNALNQYRAILSSNPITGQGLLYDLDGNLSETYISGDIDGDGDVDTTDLALMSSAYGATCAEPAPLTPQQFGRADFDGDCAIGLGDYGVLIGFYGTTGDLSLQKAYTWDAENRLVRVEPVEPAEDSTKVEFAYDYMGRRIEKRVYLHDGDDWDDAVVTRFAYYNWLCLVEYDVDSEGNLITSKKYTWGLDIAGLNGAGASIDEAAGISGLVATHDVNETSDFLHFYDGNGNTGQLVDRSDGSLAARYEYDAYGNITAQAGDYADENSYRFSTRVFDPEIGTIAYPYRIYDPRLGRWLSRDPIEEEGGVNVYVYADNEPVLRIDPDGGQSMNPHRPSWTPPLFPPTQPEEDDVELWCYEIARSGMYHCDVKCTPGWGPAVIGGGTGPGSSGGHKGSGGNPGWKDKPDIVKGSIPSGKVSAPPGTCACIRQKAAKLNQIKGKKYELPIGCGPTSNSSAALSTLLRCCGVSISPNSDLSTPGWGDNVLYKCGTTMSPVPSPGSLGQGCSDALTCPKPCYCPVTCDMLN